MFIGFQFWFIGYNLKINKSNRTNLYINLYIHK